jgi:2-amino-4-hydroxy-6-hydroxymethyldihydropteridine diphosphokinase
MINSPVQVFISLGSNLGDREKNLRTAIALIAELENSLLVKISGFYSTAAWGKSDQPDFLNAVIEIHTSQPPGMLMKNLLKLENEMGRRRDHRWGPRLIDLDILFYGDQICRTETLIIPHPEMHKRKFVLVPLQELAAEFIHPVSGKKVSEMLEECPDKLSVTAFQNAAHA